MSFIKFLILAFSDGKNIAYMQISEKPTQVRVNTLLTPRHIAQRSKVRMHARRYHPKKDSAKVKLCYFALHPMLIIPTCVISFELCFCLII